MRRPREAIPRTPDGDDEIEPEQGAVSDEEKAAVADATAQVQSFLPVIGISGSNRASTFIDTAENGTCKRRGIFDVVMSRK